MATKKKQKKDQSPEIRFEQITKEQTKIFAGGGEFDASRDPKTKRFSTTKLPYQDFDSLEDLVAAVLDKHPNFRRFGARPRKGKEK